MKIFTSLNPSVKPHRPLATLGVFDGFHRGHQSLLDQLETWAEEVGATPLVITFQGHPKELLETDRSNFPYITSLNHRLHLLAQRGIPQVILLPFDRDFSQINPRDFMEKILWKTLACRHFLMGPDSRFGYRGEGDYSMAKQIGAELGMEVRRGEPFCWDGERISSTRIRQWIRQGDFEMVAKALGRRYSLLGEVIHGDGLGRTMGFPTANLDLSGVLTPPSGVYGVSASLLPEIDGPCSCPMAGLVNIGTRPTVGGTEKRVEVHLVDFQGDLYGKNLQIIFIEKLRDEKKFASLEDLKRQIEIDRKHLQQLLPKGAPLEGEKP